MAFFRSAALLMGYYLIFLFVIPVLLRKARSSFREGSRKFQHVAFALSIFLLAELFADWRHALGAMGLLLAVAFPVLLLLERTRWYHWMLADRNRSGGELRHQLVLVQLSFGTLLLFFRGLGADRYTYVAAAAVMAWGLGDAAAALAGGRFGHLLIRHRLFSPHKSYEGFGAMVFWAGFGMMVTLWVYGGLPLSVSIFLAVATAPACALVELATRKGLDTLTVPWTAAALLMLLVLILRTGGLMG